MFECALICTDLFDGLQRLAHCVPNLACSGLKQVIFLHSIPAWEQKTIASLDTEQIKAAREKLAPALENVPEDVSVKIEVSTSRPVDAVGRILETNPVDVILIGSPMRTTMQAKLFGSTSLAVAGITDIPILLFRPQLLITYTRDELALRCEHLWKQLLIPYDGSIAALYVIEQITKQAQTGTLHSFERCVLLRVVEDSWRDETIRMRRLEDARQELEAVKTTLESLNLQVDVEVRQGTILPEILAAAGENNISAIAIGEQPKNALDWLARNTTEEMLECLWFPLLFFSPKR